ncbi:predicted unusual protein kinase [Anaerolinea thermolimosa]|uniref:ABC1 kinase family protein n=1 Tax=Anaerolinea thermolimosa TaxID=229919 RepID=UPI00078163D1|nr:AarF/ABC1/UbiB kinase family protein [Anaerolinea thermolimosa]GAP06828.1 predicted unusual protein kinase [Anaerolinea thermolimosa]
MATPPRIPWIVRRPLLQRSQQIITTLTRHGLGWLLTQAASGEDGRLRGLRRLLKQSARTQAEELVQALIELGPTFIKFGQALSARADLLPPAYITELNKLQDLVPPLPFDQMVAVLRDELGRSPDEIFAYLDPEPIASASIGQVYSARLWGGDEVVVKIVRPGAEQTFEQDLEILNDLVDWLTRYTALGQLYDLHALVEEFAHTVRNEFNYIREGRNADTFRKNFSDDSRIYIPVVYWDYTTRRVITLEKVTGLKINDLAGMDRVKIDRRAVAENLMHFALRQIFEFRLYHADPHPGNFFVQPDASLAVVDFGMVGHINEHTRRTFLGIARAIERRDSFMLVDELLEAGIFTRGINRRSFARDLERLLNQLSGIAIKDLSAAEVLRDWMDVILRNGLQLPGELVAMTRAIAISEGTGTLLYPDFNLFEFAAPYLKSFWQEEQSPSTLLPRLTTAASDSLELGLDLPRRAIRILSQIEQGKLEVNLNRQELDDLVGKFQKMTNRLTLGMILSAVIIALSLIMVVYRAETWETLGNYIFGFALISSILFGVWLIWSIIRTGRT